MNKEIRQLLIERARLNAPVTYSSIMQQMELDHNQGDHRNILSTTLGDISKFEHLMKRPLLSSLVTYSGTGMPGNGFYNLAEELQFGDASKLRTGKFDIEMQKRCHEFWGDPTNYDQYYDDVLIAENLYPNAPEFFKEEDIQFLAEWAGRTYDKNDQIHRGAKNRIMSALGSKVVFWSNELARKLGNYNVINSRIWHQKGWDDTGEENVQVAKFKSYSWARIFKEGDINKDIFFTVEVNAEELGLVYKLDYYFEKDSKLSGEQKHLCKQLIPDHVKWLVIPLEEIPNYSWSELISETLHFIQKNENLYDEIVQSVWNNKVEVSTLEDRLIQRPISPEGYTSIPPKNFAFEEKNTDWDEKQKELSETGNTGEQLVLEFERKKLISVGKTELAEKVRKVGDGAGFDIESWNEDGSIKHIEVKTTKGGHNSTFIITDNELAFSVQNPHSYHLFRVYNLNIEKRVAEFHEYIGDLNAHFLLDGIQFRVYKKAT